MTKKIDGYCQRHDNQDYLDRGNTVYVNRTPCTGKDPRCTVVVHKGKSERVFTESEVRAMFQVLRTNEFFNDGRATLMHLDDFNARVRSFFSDPA